MLKYLRFMTNVEPNNRNETNSDIFPWDILKADITLFFYQKIFKYLEDF